MEKDPLAKWRKPGYEPADLAETGGVTAVAPLSGIKPREYKAFVSDGSRIPALVLKRGTVKQPATDFILSYSTLVGGTSDSYGFVFSLLFARPGPWGPVHVEMRGEGLTPLVEGILSGTVKSAQLFDPDRHLPTHEGDFNIEADAWEGPCVIKHISVTEKHSPDENLTKH